MSANLMIYHNPECGTSRTTLAMIRYSGAEPHVIEHLKTPLSRTLLRHLSERTGASIRDVLLENGTLHGDLGLLDPDLTDEQVLDAIEAHPILPRAG